jgi:glutathione peroxidase
VTFVAALAFALIAAPRLYAQNNGAQPVAPIHKITMKGLDGKDVNFAKYKGKVLLIVNVASECGYTPQYKGLQELHKKYGKDGLVVLGVPSNDFGTQEPGTDAQIAAFCQKEYGVTFAMLSKVPVSGDKQCPLYKLLTSKDSNPKHGGAVRWNFTKFLIGRDGSIVARFEPDTEPDSDAIRNALAAELAKK